MDRKNYLQNARLAAGFCSFFGLQCGAHRPRGEQMKKFTDKELETMLEEPESFCVERKRSFREETAGTKVRQAICAFANDLPDSGQPGVLFIGADDEGAPSGERIDDELLCNLDAIKTDGGIVPPIAIAVEKRRLKGAEMAVVTVMPSDTPPVRYDGRICVRTGPRHSTANAQEERILNEKRRHRDIPFDVQPVLPATIKDLSATLFKSEYLPNAFASDVLEANSRTYEQQLASLKMIVSPEDTTPTVLGLLTLGVQPRDFLPGAYIQFLRIRGTELSDPVEDEEDTDDALQSMLRRTDKNLATHNRTGVDATSGPTHQIEADYPMVALRQILYNAVLHRTYEGGNTPVRVYWYDDRVEINSPGGPYGDVTPENFSQPGITSYRNPNIADVLKTLGFVQNFGRGIAMARDAMQRNGNPEIEFRIDQGFVFCTLRKKP